MERSIDFIPIIINVLPTLTVLISVLTALIFLTRGRIRFGKFQLDFERASTERYRKILEEDDNRAIGGTSPHNALLREYHAQGLSQSRVSFWFSLVFASLGFAIIALSVGIFLQQLDHAATGWLDTAGKPIFTLIAGTVIDAVAALFFVQSNKARELMTEFFDKLRSDRKLDEALRLVEAIPDAAIGSRTRAIIALNFSDASLGPSVLSALVSGDAAKSSFDAPPGT
jgi:hypothetical protein